MPWPFNRKTANLPSPDPADISSSPSDRFAFTLFRALLRADDEGNLFLSPLSVLVCLAMVHELATGETRSAIADALKISKLDDAEIRSEVASQRSAFRARTNLRMSCANSLWLGKHAHISAEMKTLLRDVYDSEVHPLDFDAPDAVQTINDWVATRTSNKITHIVNKLSPLSMLVALNAVYFSGFWINPFRPELTLDAPFHTTSGQKKSVPMMARRGTFRYYEETHFQAVALPYSGGVSLHVLLPAARTDLRRFQLNLTGAFLDSVIQNSVDHEGVVRLPRFEVAYQAQLKATMTALGMGRAFKQNQAEFGHVSTDQPPIWLHDLIHRAVVEVNEKGTEASAATMGMMFCGAALNSRAEELFLMIVDRPFLFLIRDDVAGKILFMGWIADPS